MTQQMPSIHEMPSLFDMPTIADPGQFAQAQAEAPIEPQPGEAPPDLPPDNKWGHVEFFATRCLKAVEIERDIMACFDRRANLARRLMDAAKRKDDKLAVESAKQWMDTEVTVAKAMDVYAPVVAERAAVLRQLGM